MYRNIVVALSLLLLSVSVANANLILNGGFEDNSAVGTSVNLSNSDFNSLVNNVTAFGTSEEIDLFYNPQPNGDWSLGLHNGADPDNPGLFDGFSLELSSPIIAGTSYDLQFFARGLPPVYGGANGPVQIGMSDISTDFGDLLFSGLPIASLTDWTQFDFSFNATMNKSFLTVRTDPSVYSNYAYVDDFSLTVVPEPSTFLLLGGGLAGLAFYARRRKKE